MKPQAALAGYHFDVLGTAAIYFPASSPRCNPVGLGENRGGRNRRRGMKTIQAPAEAGRDVSPHQKPNHPGVEAAWLATKRAREGNHTSNGLGHQLGELSRIDAAQAPTHQTDPAVIALIEFRQALHQLLAPAVCQPEISSKLPSVGLVAERSDVATQDPRGDVTGRKARQDKDWMPVASGRATQEGEREHQQARCYNGARRFKQEQRKA